MDFPNKSEAMNLLIQDIKSLIRYVYSYFLFFNNK